MQATRELETDGDLALFNERIAKMVTRKPVETAE